MRTYVTAKNTLSHAYLNNAWRAGKYQKFGTIYCSIFSLIHAASPNYDTEACFTSACFHDNIEMYKP